MKLKMIIPGIAGALSVGIAYAFNSTSEALALITSEGQKQVVTTPTGGLNIILIGAAALFVVWYLNRHK